MSVATRCLQSGESAHIRVDDLYLELLGRHADPSGGDFWAARMVTDDEISVAVTLAASDEYYARAHIRYP